MRAGAINLLLILGGLVPVVRYVDTGIGTGRAAIREFSFLRTVDARGIVITAGTL